ncbi:MAG: hypothetical protein RSA52_10310, partial [Acetivibrio sp.]
EDKLIKLRNSYRQEFLSFFFSDTFYNFFKLYSSIGRSNKGGCYYDGSGRRTKTTLRSKIVNNRQKK